MPVTRVAYVKRDSGCRHVNVTQLYATWCSESDSAPRRGAARHRHRQAAGTGRRATPPYSCELVSYARRTPGPVRAHTSTAAARRIVLIADPLNDRWTDRLGTRVFTARPSFTKMHVNSDACTRARFGTHRCAREKCLAVDIDGLLLSIFFTTRQWLSVVLWIVWIYLSVSRLKICDFCEYLTSMWLCAFIVKDIINSVWVIVTRIQIYDTGKYYSFMKLTLWSSKWKLMKRFRRFVN